MQVPRKHITVITLLPLKLEGAIRRKTQNNIPVSAITEGYSPEETARLTLSSTCATLPSTAEVTTAAGTPHSGRPKLPLSPDTPRHP